MKQPKQSDSKSPAKKGSAKKGSGSGKAGSKSKTPDIREKGFRANPSGSGKESRRMTSTGTWKANLETKPAAEEKPTPTTRPSITKRTESKSRPKPSGTWKPSVPVKAGSIKKGHATERASSTGVRLNRFIANTGVCSRREADELISSGSIEVNGKTITELGTRVAPTDSVRYKGKLLKGERKVYVLLNKPKDCVTTVKDTHGRKTVLDMVSGCCTERIYPVGRLDRNTTGVLLLTNDGELADILSHPSFNKKKIYHIHLDKALSLEHMNQLREGFELEDGFIQPDRVEYVEDADKNQVGIEIHSGRNRIVRRMLEHLDYKVLRLDRVYFAGLTKKGLSRGRWRHLTEKEVNMLKMSIPRRKPEKRSSKP